MTKRKKIKSAELVSEWSDIFRCPHCGTKMQVEAWKSLTCVHHHTFDFTKQGYLNLMKQPIKSNYDKTLFEARQHVVGETELFQLLHQRISEILSRLNKETITILDVGCGEGSHLHQIMEGRLDRSLVGIGLDIAKEGILQAAKNYIDPIWVVGNLANAPFQKNVFDVVINILSPSNYVEFKRLVASNGLIIKVVPRNNYLSELREVLMKSEKREMNNKDEVVSLFQDHFETTKRIPLTYRHKLNQTVLHDLVRMTPLAWSADPKRIQSFTEQESAEITIDLDILIGRNN